MQPSTQTVTTAVATEPVEPVTVFLAFLEDEGGIYLGGSLTLDGAKQVAEQSEYAAYAATRTGAGIVWNDEPREWNDGKGTREWTGTIEHDYYSVRQTTLS
jgi:hypothetical protein